jgi:hypothetical protein
MHRDEVLHFLSLMKSPKIDFNQEDSWILGKLALLLLGRKQNTVQEFAASALEIFKQHNRFAETKRICLAKRIGVSNSIMVKSCEHIMQQENTMLPGYSCYVDGKGSLFSMNASEIRIYEDACKVMASFQELNKPVQRSIKRIAAMNLKSGICLPLFHKDRSIGFLFMNSSDASFAKLRDSDYCIFSYFEAISTLALLDSGLPSEAFYGLAKEHLPRYEGNILSEEVFANTLDQHLKSLDNLVLKSEISMPPAEILVSMGTIANLLSRLIYTLKTSSVQIKVEIQNEKVFWSVTFSGGRELSTNHLPVALIWDDFRALEMPLHIEHNQLKFSMNLETVDAQHRVKYSI